MACGSCGGSHAARSSVTTGMVNASRERYKVTLPDGSSETFDEYIDAVRMKKSNKGSTMMSVRS